MTPQLRLGCSIDDIRQQCGLDGPAGLLTNPAALPVALNVALFVPLRAFVRHLSHRGRYSGMALVAVVGLATSLLLEPTQLTGIWRTFDCSYRLFTVDDLLANTAGALLGALIAPLLRRVPGRRPVAPEQAPRSDSRRHGDPAAWHLDAAPVAALTHEAGRPIRPNRGRVAIDEPWRRLLLCTRGKRARRRWCRSAGGGAGLVGPGLAVVPALGARGPRRIGVPARGGGGVLTGAGAAGVLPVRLTVLLRPGCATDRRLLPVVLRPDRGRRIPTELPPITVTPRLGTGSAHSCPL